MMRQDIGTAESWQATARDLSQKDIIGNQVVLDCGACGYRGDAALG